MTIGNTSLKLLAVTLAATLALAACAGASEDDGGAQAAQSTAGDSQAPAAQSAGDATQTQAEASADTGQPKTEQAAEEAKTTQSQDETDSSGQSTPDFAKKVATASDVEFDGIASWINSEPLTLDGLKGNVVLVDFWTYSCINCIRTLPYVKSWHDKYADQGLVVVGMHSPEFSFEKDRAGVIEAAAKFGLEYPIAQDNDFVTWQVFNNMYWPTKYLIDRNGVIRYTHIGEGAYEKTEQMIQQLLAEPDA